MSEKIYAFLLRLYPARFRHSYGEDALRLFRGRLCDETGFFRQFRLWLDILVDLAVSLPSQNVGARPEFAVETGPHRVGMPIFFVLEGEVLRPSALFSGFAFTLVALSLAAVLLNQPSTYRARNLGSAKSEFSSPNDWPTSAATKSGDSAPQVEEAVYGPDDFVTTEEFFPPPIDYLALTNIRRNPDVERVFVYATPDTTTANSHARQAVYARAALPAACVDEAALDPERQRVLDAVIANLKQHYFDSAVAQQMADALVELQRCGDAAHATDSKIFAALLTSRIRDVSHDMHLQVVYNPASVSQPTPEEFARMLASLQQDNCSFKEVQILPRNIGYLRLDAFLSPSVCRSTAVVAMASLNNADALIFDLRKNRGGTAEMVSLISSYLFDHPEYMFDPRRVPRAQSWTSSPVPGSKLPNKPVFILTSHTTISAADTAEQAMLLATLQSQSTAFRAQSDQTCVATNQGTILPDGGTGNPEVDDATRRAGSLGDRPLVVLTAGRYWKPDDPVLAKQADEFHDVWVHQLQASLARLSTRGRQIVVANADHGIAGEAPDVVVDAVRSVVDQIRAEVKQ